MSPQMNDLFIEENDYRPGTTSNKSSGYYTRFGKTSQRFYASPQSKKSDLNSYRKASERTIFSARGRDIQSQSSKFSGITKDLNQKRFRNGDNPAERHLREIKNNTQYITEPGSGGNANVFFCRTLMENRNNRKHDIKNINE